MMGEAERMADDIVLVHQGKVVFQVRWISSVPRGKNTLHIEFDETALLENLAAGKARDDRQQRCRVDSRGRC